jgi:hypothetical protein
LRLVAVVVLAAIGFFASFAVGRATSGSSDPTTTQRVEPKGESVEVVRFSTPKVAVLTPVGRLPALVEPPPPPTTTTPPPPPPTTVFTPPPPPTQF